MSGGARKVDVLGVIDAATATCVRYQHAKSADDLPEARGAVADLIAAAREVTAAFRAIGRDRAIVTPAGLVKRAEEAMVRLDLATDRIGGAP